MKCKSAADIKDWHSRPNKINLPREGTNLRKAYDLFQNNKGVIINTTLRELGIDRGGSNQLIDFYGLDIRKFGYRRWCLVGEWFGKVYVDYLAEKIKPKVKKK